MDEVQMRLTKCFRAVFPVLPVAEIPECSQQAVSLWDSIASITLLSVIEEEFGFEIDFDQISEFSSFGRILSYIRTQV
jgi:acyl carrier protein